jgi:hypothetical protein
MTGSWATASRLGPLGFRRLLIGTLWAATLVLLLYRVRFGVSNRDEAFYSAMPYSFLLGCRPYVDELALHQNAAILMVPFFRLYLAINGSSDGIVVFNRYLYVVYLGVCSLLTYRYVQPRWGRALACAASLLVLVFSYCNLFALSYNTLGAFGFFCGVLLSANAVETARPGLRLFAASALFLSAMFAYPGLAPAVLAYALVVVIWLYRNATRPIFRQALLGLGAGVMLCLSVVVPLAMWIGRAGFDRLLAFSQSMGYAQGAFSNLGQWADVVPWRWPLLGFAVVFVVWPALTAWVPRLTWLVALLGVGCCGWFYALSFPLVAPTPATLCLSALPLLAPACVVLNRAWRGGRTLLVLVWLPGALAMLCSVATSANRYQAASLGSLAVELAGIVAFAKLCESISERAKKPALIAQWSLLVTLFVIQTHSLFVRVYSDTWSFAENTTRVRRGPLRGALTTAYEAKLLAALHRDLKSVESPGQTLTVFDNFATGYLSTRLKPRTFTHWIVWVMRSDYSKAIMRETFGSPEKLPDVVLKIGYKSARRYWPAYERNHYQVVVDRPEYGYTILKKK